MIEREYDHIDPFSSLELCVHVHKRINRIAIINKPKAKKKCNSKKKN